MVSWEFLSQIWWQLIPDILHILYQSTGNNIIILISIKDKSVIIIYLIDVFIAFDYFLALHSLKGCHIFYAIILIKLCPVNYFTISHSELSMVFLVLNLYFIIYLYFGFLEFFHTTGFVSERPTILNGLSGLPLEWKNNPFMFSWN